MKKFHFVYPKRFTNKDFNEILEIAQKSCKYFLFSCRVQECDNQPLVLDLGANLVQKDEKQIFNKYSDVVYLFKLNNLTMDILKNYSSSIYIWSEQGKPEDLCFLREDKSYLFSSVVHENYFDFDLTEDEIVLFRQHYEHRLCPTKYLDLLPIYSDGYIKRMQTVIRRRSFNDYLHFLVKSYAFAEKVTERKIRLDEVSRYPSFPLIQKQQHLIDLIERSMNNISDDKFSYFVNDVNKDDLAAIQLQVKNSQDKLSQYTKTNRIKSNKYFENCRSELEKEHSRLVQKVQSSRPWEKILWEENANNIAELIKITSNLLVK